MHFNAHIYSSIFDEICVSHSRLFASYNLFFKRMYKYYRKSLNEYVQLFLPHLQLS